MYNDTQESEASVSEVLLCGVSADSLPRGSLSARQVETGSGWEEVEINFMSWDGGGSWSVNCYSLAFWDGRSGDLCLGMGGSGVFNCYSFIYLFSH